MTMISPSALTLNVAALPPVGRGIFRALCALSVGDTEAEAAVWGHQTPAGPFSDMAVAWVKERQAAVVAAQTRVERLSFQRVREEVEGNVPALGLPGSDMQRWVNGLLLRFRWPAGAWLAYRSVAEGTLWAPLPDGEPWPALAIDLHAERVAAGLEPDVTPAQRVELEKRPCQLHGGPIFRCACPAMIDVLVQLHRSLRTPRARDEEEANAELAADFSQAEDQRAVEPIMSPESCAAEAAASYNKGLSAAIAPAPAPASTPPPSPAPPDEAPKPDPTAAAPAAGPAQGASATGLPTASAAGDPKSILDKLDVSTIPPVFRAVCMGRCGASVNSPAPDEPFCSCGSIMFRSVAGDPERPSPAYAALVLPNVVSRDPKGCYACAICGEPFVVEGEPPLVTIRGAKLPIGVHPGCALEHAPEKWRTAGAGRECATCKRPITTEAVLLQLPGAPGAVGVHRDTRECLAPTPAVADELKKIERAWKLADEPAGRKLKAPCKGCQKPIEKGMSYFTRGEERMHQGCLTPATA